MEFFQPITKEQLTSEFYKQIASSAGKFYNYQFFKCNKTEKIPTYKASLTTFEQLLSGAPTQNSTEKVEFQFEMTKIAY